MPPIHPARNGYFGVLLWDLQGPGIFGSDDVSEASQIANNIVGGLVANLTNLLFGGFTGVDNLQVQLDIESLNEGGNNYAPRVFAKQGKVETALVLKRGATARTDLWDWHQQVINDTRPAIRKSGLIILFDRGAPVTGEDDEGRATGEPPSRVTEDEGLSELNTWTRIPQAAWYISRALPEKVSIDNLDSGREKLDTVVYESVTMRHEGITRVSLASIPGAAQLASMFFGILPAGASAVVGSLTLTGR